MSKKIFLSLITLLALVSSCYNNDDTDTTVVDREKQLKDSIALYPDSLLFRENLIQYYRDNNNYTEALAATQDYLKKDSLSARLWDIEATLYFEEKDTPNSIQAFETAVAIHPDPPYLMSLGSLYAETKDPRALAVADALIKNSNGDELKNALFIKGLYHSTAGDCNNAIPYYDSCLKIDYTFTLAYREKAICFYNMGRYNDALNVLSKAIEIVNTYEEAYYWMGRCHEKLNDKADAIKDYQTAVQIDKDYIEAKDALARLGANAN
jgi:tetratricopeptide (TPR) repeat protein